MSKFTETMKRFFTRVGAGICLVGKTLWRWTSRMFMGASKSLVSKGGDPMEVEALESPMQLAVKTFFRRKLAVGALILLIALFLLVFIGPLIWPMDAAFTDANQANIAPNLSMRSVPRALRKAGIRDISSFGTFSVGVSQDNTLYMWGYTEDALVGHDYSKFPDEIEEGKVFAAAAGSDFVIAVTTEGKIVGWGDNTRGQLGFLGAGTNAEDPIVELPEEIRRDGIDPAKFRQLICGYQASVLVLEDATYIWGNYNACQNMLDIVASDKLIDVKKATLSNYYGVFLLNDGTVVSPGYNLRREFVMNSEGKMIQFSVATAGHRIVDIASTKNTFAFLLDNGEILIQGAAERGEDAIPALPEGEKAVSIDGGAYHYVAVTDAGNAYTWGLNDQKQCELSGEACAVAYAGSYQTYLVEEDGDVNSCGLRGYLFGTDGQGRDTFRRIIHGGKTTMTIGAVAVIVSSFIAIVVGCLSGYFGGWVDMLLMRVTEIFASIPFLPFAMLLSYVLMYTTVGEGQRMFLIMVILGVLSWTGLAHMIRAQVLAEREKEFVLAAKAMGVKENRIAFKHILPNVISVILVSMTLDFAGCLLTESSLSYLGFGVQQPNPTWGNMLNSANNSIVIQNYWWQWLIPAIFLSLATISINIIGDTLRDVLDPKSSREK